MFIQVNETLFIECFQQIGRGDQFSIPALRSLFEYYEQLEQDTGDNIELDVIAICVDWGEYTADELVKEYGEDNEQAEDVADRLRDETMILETDAGTYLVLAF